MHKTSSQRPLIQLRFVALAAAILIYILIVLGGIVRITGSGGACPDWPTCLGAWTPPSGLNPLVDYAHRFATFLATPFILAAGWLAWRGFRRSAWFVGPALVAAILVSMQIGIGAALSLRLLPQSSAGLSALHLGLSLLALSALTTVTTAAFYQSLAARNQVSTPARLTFRSPFARLSLLTFGVVFGLLVSGALVTGSQASFACAGWPLCGAGLPGTGLGWLNLGHRLAVALAGGLMLVTLVQAWRTQRTQPAVLTATTASFVLFVSQALLGARLVEGFPAYLVGLHQATAVAVWGALSVQLAAVGLAGRSAEDERLEAESMRGRKGLAKDLLLLTKPIVVVLLLVTTYAGMVIGAQAWPSAWLTFWTLLGGFMAAGGSGAINQYIDRDDDRKMQRTQKRPIPDGRLTPGEGLAFGVGLALGSFFLMTAFVSFLAALLSLAGIFYYVLLYSIFLKKTTVQNIVIGGGAGALPPLVGWAAATGSLNIPSLFLFAVIFMWTPPHFWALALVRRQDYARAGVPMLPVVRGEKETRWQIFIYTVELVGLTLLLPLFGLGGAIYLVGAAALGGWLLLAAWKVWKEGGNKLAWKMYRYSSMYLAFIFLVLMIDRLM